MEKPDVHKAFIDGNGPGWKTLILEDFTKVNSADDTWSFKDGAIHCTGEPLSVMRTKKKYKNFSRDAGEWNHYYFRAIYGEVRLWVNGEEVSGGSGANPSSRYICLESEGAPIEFRLLKIRELP